MSLRQAIYKWFYSRPSKPLTTASGRTLYHAYDDSNEEAFYGINDLGEFQHKVLDIQLLERWEADPRMYPVLPFVPIVAVESAPCYRVHVPFTDYWSKL